MWLHLKSKLTDWERGFLAIWLMKSIEHLDADRDYITKELTLLKEEKRAYETRFSTLMERIAQVRILVDDLDEELCSKLSGGHSLAAVGETLLREFTEPLNGYNMGGRTTVLDFLTKHYHIPKRASRRLFLLLEQAGTLQYCFGVSKNLKNEPLVYCEPGEGYSGLGLGPLPQFNGWWEIRA